MTLPRPVRVGDWPSGNSRAIIAYVCWRPHDGDAQLIPEAVMRSIVAVLILATACLATAAVAAPLSVETYTLPNGMTVILHEDHACRW